MPNTRSAIDREALARYEACDGDDDAAARPYDAWLDVIGVVSLGARNTASNTVRNAARTTGKQFTTIIRQQTRTGRAR